MVETIELLHKNVGILAPSQLNFEEIYNNWKIINEELHALYKKFINDR